MWPQDLFHERAKRARKIEMKGGRGKLRLFVLFVFFVVQIPLRFDVRF
jgi:hypothetical protein